MRERGRSRCGATNHRRRHSKLGHVWKQSVLLVCRPEARTLSSRSRSSNLGFVRQRQDVSGHCAAHGSPAKTAHLRALRVKITYCPWRRRELRGFGPSSLMRAGGNPLACCATRALAVTPSIRSLACTRRCQPNARHRLNCAERTIVHVRPLSAALISCHPSSRRKALPFEQSQEDCLLPGSRR